MEKLASIICLLLFSLYILFTGTLFSPRSLFAFLFISSVLLTLFSLHKSRRRIKSAGAIILGILTAIFPEVFFTSPAIMFFMLENCKWAVLILPIAAVGLAPILDAHILSGVTVGCAFSLLVYVLSEKCAEYKQKYLASKDLLSFENSALASQNLTLARQTEDAVAIAVLTERNRIAREIHDNVGHMLTRAILQTGAMQIINSQENLADSLTLVKATLDEAMTSIRKSVHDLHDDSINLKFAAEDCIKALPDSFTVSLTYDMGEDMDRDSKLCIIGVLKESISNIIRHSDGDRVQIIMSEHPTFYKLSVTDNGNARKKDHGGIGIINMKNRVRERGGILDAGVSEEGFRIYMTLPKGENYS